MSILDQNILENIRIICNNLVETFNANSIDKLSNNMFISAVFYDLAKRYENTANDNTLFKLIRNHYSKYIRKPDVYYIGGPFHLTKHLSNTQNTTIYCFGERHSNIIDCPLGAQMLRIEDYMSYLLESTDAFIDFYIEIPIFEKDYYKRTDLMAEQRIQSLFQRFYRCIQKLTRKNRECKLSRIHYIDIRTSDSTSDFGKTILSRISLIGSNDPDNINMYSLVYYLNKYRKDFGYFFNNIEIDNAQLNLNYWIVKILEEPKLRKELERSYMNEQIYDYLVELTRNKFYEYGHEFIANLVKKTSKYFNNYRGEFRENNININFARDIIDLGRVIGNIISVYIDGYCLARIFKEFKVENRLEQPVRPKNIVIYAEDRHVQNYRRFIERYAKFIKVEESGQYYEDVGMPVNPRYCVNMANIKQPFFE